MAKGLRSKSKRANRAALRAEITIPMQIQRQEKIAQKIKDGLNETAKSKSISTLRSAFNLNGSRINKTKNNTEKEEESVAKVTSSSSTSVIIDGSITDVPPKKRSGSKPRLNVNKELTWFK